MPSQSNFRKALQFLEKSKSMEGPIPKTNKSLVLIGGPAGSGKTHIGKLISKKAGGVYVDKDTMSGLFTEKMLKINGFANERESDFYLSKIRPVEYESMMSVAFENISLGHIVICSAPFLLEFTNSKWVNGIKNKCSVKDANLFLMWVNAAENVCKDRLIKRSLERDKHKLSSWDKYVKSTPFAPPKTNDLIVIDNNPFGAGQINSLDGQIESLVHQIIKN